MENVLVETIILENHLTNFAENVTSSIKEIQIFFLVVILMDLGTCIALQS